MSKNLKRYYQAWELKQQGKTSKELGLVTGISKSRVLNWLGILTLK